MEEEFNDIFTGYENDLQKAVALVEWQKSEIESLTIYFNTFSLALKNLEKERHEVAREIFEEIEKTVALKIPAKITPIFKRDLDYSHGVIDGKRDALFEVLVLLAELKKKYTKGGE